MHREEFQSIGTVNEAKTLFMNIKIEIFSTQAGSEPYTEWVNELDKQVQAIIFKRLDRVKLGNFGDCSPITNGVWELRIHCGPGYRIYFGKKGNKIIILLIGGYKKSQKRDIARALEHWAETENNCGKK